MKVQVQVNDELVKKIDFYAKTLGMSRSSLCALFIGQGVLGYSKAFEAIDTLIDGVKSGEISGQIDMASLMPKIETMGLVEPKKRKSKKD